MKKREIKKPRKVFKKRPCRLCKDKAKSVDYKDVALVSRFVSDRGRIISSRITGSCAKHQRMISNAIKRARLAGLLPFVKIKEGMPRRRPQRRD